MTSPELSLEVHAEHWRDMLPHLETLKRYAAEAKVIVEFGVRGAVSTWAFLDGLPEDGRMWSVDIEPAHVPIRVAEDRRWAFVHGDDRDPDVWVALPSRADLVFIDTSHELEHTRFELLRSQVLNPRRIVLHDACWPGVSGAIFSFIVIHGWKLEEFHLANDSMGDFSLASLVR